MATLCLCERLLERKEMVVTAHVLPKYHDALMRKTFNLTSDKLMVGLVASGTDPIAGAGWQGYATVADFLTNGTYPQTEHSTSGTGYSRQQLASVSVNTTGLYTTLVIGTAPYWPASTITAVRAFFYNAAVDTNDTTRLLIAYWDFGGTDSDTGGVFTLNMPTANSIAGALQQFTAS